MIEKINVGIAGSCGRGRSFKIACEASGILKIHAVCDVNEKKIEESRVALGAEEKYLDYYEMIEKSNIQAVIIGTPMQFHSSQAIAVLKTFMFSVKSLLQFQYKNVKRLFLLLAGQKHCI
ncbi:MAG: Gfo/Idh/MocA family oxidoreductase [Candidatus Omnitrophica bacterium]|nr:Gfo/Idh/MocA family oxidoreductase [Candidatus Omnitrophota bacterium]MCM8803080.1 Gfo/Idh/MocA family oxidoreductase [Candidatus Omnitrophota bacterium]